MKNISLLVNGQKVVKQVSDRTHLGDFLREQVGLTGTHLGCEHGVCGACTVLSDGQPIRSCITFAVACEGKAITTVEGYADDPVMSLLREAFTAHHALQCGYCTPGMLACARDIVLRIPEADEQRVRIELAGNICRCTGYVGIVAAILSVLNNLRHHPDANVQALRQSLSTPKSASNAQDLKEKFTVFEVESPPLTAQAQPTIESSAAPITQSAVLQTASVKNLTHIEDTFDIAFDSNAVWQFMTDLPAVAACLPGAVIEAQDGELVKGRVAIKFGPMAAAFVGSARLEKNDATFTALLKGSGQDSLSQSRASGDVQYRLQTLGAAMTRVHVQLAYSLQGPLAQFSRSGLVQEFVRRMIADFGKNVSARLTNPDLSQALNAKAIHPASILIALIWSKIKRLFGGKV